MANHRLLLTFGYNSFFLLQNLYIVCRYLSINMEYIQLKLQKIMIHNEVCSFLVFKKKDLSHNI